jgi:hypothetical protein
MARTSTIIINFVEARVTFMTQAIIIIIKVEARAMTWARAYYYYYYLKS